MKVCPENVVADSILMRDEEKVEGCYQQEEEVGWKILLLYHHYSVVQGSGASCHSPDCQRMLSHALVDLEQH